MRKMDYREDETKSKILANPTTEQSSKSCDVCFFVNSSITVEVFCHFANISHLVVIKTNSMVLT